VRGVSTRRVEGLVETLGIACLSKSQVSEIAKTSTSWWTTSATVHWIGAPTPMWWDDALSLKVRKGGRVVRFLAGSRLMLASRLKSHYRRTRSLGRHAISSPKTASDGHEVLGSGEQVEQHYLLSPVSAPTYHDPQRIDRLGTLIETAVGGRRVERYGVAQIELILLKTDLYTQCARYHVAVFSALVAHERLVRGGGPADLVDGQEEVDTFPVTGGEQFPADSGVEFDCLTLSWVEGGPLVVPSLPGGTPTQYVIRAPDQPVDRQVQFVDQ
jgi:hypothetical protein